MCAHNISVKRYVVESGSVEVGKLIGDAEALGTALVSRAEVSAALARAVRMKLIGHDAGIRALKAFAADWPHLVRLQLPETLVARAAGLAWEHGLRGYDSVHLAAALLWHETLGAPVVVATFDRPLWSSARAAGLTAWPDA